MMFKIYISDSKALDMLAMLAEFRCRVYANKPIKSRTRKIRSTKLYKVVNFPV